jgi:hypothetical protein
MALALNGQIMGEEVGGAFTVKQCTQYVQYQNTVTAEKETLLVFEPNF